MLCCLIGSAAIAAGAVSVPAVPRIFTWRRGRVAAAVLAIAGTAAFVGHHLDHYAARAAANQRDILAEIRAMPLCTGTPAA